MGGMRMTGLISGMDTESMVKELVKANSTKVDNVKKEKQKLEWKKEAWQDLNTKIYNFYKTQLSAVKSNGTFKTKKATVNDSTKLSVDASSSATNGTHKISVKQIASSAYMTGTNIKATGNSYTRYLNAGASTNFADMTDADGNSLNLTGQTISIKRGNDIYPELNFELGGTGDNGVANINELNKKLSETEGYKDLKASFVDGKLTFTNSTLKTAEDGTKTGDIFTVESSALGLSGEVGFESDKDAGKTNTLTGTVGMSYKNVFSSNDINKGTKLSDIGISVGTTFSINGRDFVVDAGSTIDSLTTAFSKMGVSANFDEKQGRFYINASGTGSDKDFTVTSSDSNALDILGLGSSATKIDAQDAIIDYNGVEYRNSSNTFSINGLNITAKAVTGEYDPVTGKMTNDNPINVEVAADVDGAYNQVKEFVKAYNALIDEMYSLYDEEKTDYEPLTDEERSQLSDTQIEQWEKKAKQGLLRRDQTINSLLSSMRTTLNKGVTVTMDDGSTKQFTLASLGIVTGDYSEHGKLHILGDEDDPAYSTEDNKLKAALRDNPNVVAQAFAGSTGNKGIALQMYDDLTKAMRRVEGSSSSLTFYNDVTMKNEIDDYDDEIEKWKEKLQKMEDKYYDQFAAMESAMAKLQTQQSYLSSLLGGGA